jgi:galactokinase
MVAPSRPVRIVPAAFRKVLGQVIGLRGWKLGIVPIDVMERTGDHRDAVCRHAGRTTWSPGRAVRHQYGPAYATGRIGASSAALECSVAAAVFDLLDLGLLRDDSARATLAAICVNAENTIAQAPTGGMDQSAALRCQIGHALLLDCRDGSIAQVPFDLSAHGLSLLIMDTRVEHSLVDGQYEQRRASCEEAAKQLGLPSLREVDFNDLEEILDQLSDHRVRARARHIVSEIERVRKTVALLLEGRVHEVGSLFNASHSSMRDDFEISCAELDLAVEAATTHRALGARMTGGGFGGSAIALVPAERAAEVTSAVTHAFADKGFGRPDCFEVAAGGPARRES